MGKQRQSERRSSAGAQGSALGPDPGNRGTRKEGGRRRPKEVEEREIRAMSDVGRYEIEGSIIPSPQ
eukprot:scaffold109169_cov35-Tisochrysis_lutea.AAC.1